MKPWTDIPLFVIDFEGHPVYGVVEYGVVRMEGGEPVEAQTSLCRPTGRIRTDDIRVHGVSEEATRGSAPFSDSFDLFADMRREGVFVAHHKMVENNFLKRVWPFPPFATDWSDPDRQVASWGPWIDTLVLYLNVFPALESHRLGDLVRRFGLQPELDELAARFCPARRAKYHCALYDALASALLLQALGRLDGFADMQLSWLIAQSQRSSLGETQTELFD